MKKRYVIVIQTPKDIRRDIKELDDEEVSVARAALPQGWKILLFCETNDVTSVMVALRELGFFI